MSTHPALIFIILFLAGCSGQPALTPLESGDVILAFGDSLTYGTGVAAEQSYPAVLSDMSGFEVVRSGVPGETSSQGLERLPRVLQDVAPDLVILCHGGNDVLRRMDPVETEENLRKMIRKIRAYGADVALLAVPKMGLFPGAPDYYTRIRDDMQVPVEIDIVATLQSDSTMKSDRVHFNDKGYRKMAEAAHSMLKEAGAI
ncbi:MAG: GDSL-type esterase/lipase family protein [Pseudomonadales bacterium]